jgi:hypothetical protein
VTDLDVTEKRNYVGMMEKIKNVGIYDCVFLSFFLPDDGALLELGLLVGVLPVFDGRFSTRLAPVVVAEHEDQDGRLYYFCFLGS